MLSIVRDISARKATEQRLAADAHDRSADRAAQPPRVRAAVERRLTRPRDEPRAIASRCSTSTISSSSTTASAMPRAMRCCAALPASRGGGARKRFGRARRWRGIRDPLPRHVGRAGDADLRPAAHRNGADATHASIGDVHPGHGQRRRWPARPGGLDHALKSADLALYACQAQRAATSSRSRRDAQAKLKLMLSRSALAVPGSTSWRSQLSHSSSIPGRGAIVANGRSVFGRVLAARRRGHHQPRARILEADRTAAGGTST